MAYGAYYCDACLRELLGAHVHFDADGVQLILCGGCAGEATAFAQYGDDAVTNYDWREVRRIAAERNKSR